MVSEILRQHPQLGSGFEGGLLFSDDPQEFRSLEPYLSSLKVSWGVDDEDLEYICSGAGWQEVYGRLLERSRKVDSKFIFDKTPKYMKSLTDVLSRVDVPCIAITRDPRALFYSWAKRTDFEADDWCKQNISKLVQRYKSYGHGLKKALKTNPGRVLVVQYESLCVNPIVEAERMLTFIGLDFDETFVQFVNPNKNIHQKTISSDYITEYRTHISDETSNEIILRLKKFKDWFWD